MTTLAGLLILLGQLSHTVILRQAPETGPLSGVQSWYPLPLAGHPISRAAVRPAGGQSRATGATAACR